MLMKIWPLRTIMSTNEALKRNLKADLLDPLGVKGHAEMDDDVSKPIFQKNERESAGRD